jgi:hypothetical protein
LKPSSVDISCFGNQHSQASVSACAVLVLHADGIFRKLKHVEQPMNPVGFAASFPKKVTCLTTRRFFLSAKFFKVTPSFSHSIFGA